MSGGRMALRERLEWLLVAMASGRYGPSIDTSMRDFEADFIVATGAQTDVMPGGRERARHLVVDLTEIVDRGQATRESKTVREDSHTRNYARFTLTQQGRDEARAIAARTTKETA